MRFLRWVPVMLSIGFAARPARATDNFPNAIQRDLGLSYSPPCSVCHVGGVTQQGTVNTPFGKAMRAQGLVAYDENRLASTLATMQSSRVDSDGDGALDVDELKAGTDPNVSDVPGKGIGPDDPSHVPPEYGCNLSARRGGRRSGPREFLPWVALAAFAARTARIRSDRRRPQWRGEGR